MTKQNKKRINLLEFELIMIREQLRENKPRTDISITKLSELKVIAEHRGIKHIACYKKQELINILNEGDK